MSSPEQPPSQASTVTESAAPSTEKTDSVLSHDIDEKVDPWLVSFAPGDPENPLVCSAFPPVSSLRLSQRLHLNRRTGPDGNGGISPPSEEC